MEKEKKTWWVFDTPHGRFVSLKKMTQKEANVLYTNSFYHLDYSDSFGLEIWGRDITSTVTSASWTRKAAEEYARNKDRDHLQDLMIHLEESSEGSDG